jgi:hypothetical protein
MLFIHPAATFQTCRIYTPCSIIYPTNAGPNIDIISTTISNNMHSYKYDSFTLKLQSRSNSNEGEEENGEKNGNHDSNSNSKNNNNKQNIPTLVDAYTPLLNKRLIQLRANLLEEQVHKPPNPLLQPEEVITLLLKELHSGTTSSLPDSGFRTLLRTSTNNWKTALRKSIGAPDDATEEQLVSALSGAMSRPNNQYQILVSPEEDDDEDNDTNDINEKYHLYFPGDVFEYDDGKVWVETQLRHPKTGKLLAILAWSLIQRENDGAWLVDCLDWQDFRDAFRPGIGREEWSRICG